MLTATSRSRSPRRAACLSPSYDAPRSRTYRPCGLVSSPPDHRSVRPPDLTKQDFIHAATLPIVCSFTILPENTILTLTLHGSVDPSNVIVKLVVVLSHQTR